MVADALVYSLCAEKLAGESADDTNSTASVTNSPSSVSLNDYIGNGGAARDDLMSRSHNNGEMTGLTVSLSGEVIPSHQADLIEDEDPKEQQPPLEFSISEVKAMVIESLPDTVREFFPPDVWDRIFSDADSVLSDGIVSISTKGSKVGVNDIVSYISDRLQARVKNESGHRSDISEMSSFSTDVSSHAGSSKGNSNPNHVRTQILTPRDLPVTSKTPAVPTKLTVVSASQAKPRVRFNLVRIRSYERTIAYNPSVRSGPAVGIGWNYTEMKDVSVDDWELHRSSNRRNAQGLVLPRLERTNILFDAGFSRKDIVTASRATLKDKNNRRQTYNNLKYQAMEEFMEKTTRRVKRAVTLGFVSRSNNKNYKNSTNFEPSKQPARSALVSH
jgi:hypothetical protein